MKLEHCATTEAYLECVKRPLVIGPHVIQLDDACRGCDSKNKALQAGQRCGALLVIQWAWPRTVAYVSEDVTSLKTQSAQGEGRTTRMLSQVPWQVCCCTQKPQCWTKNAF
jgi:hypothetical protein